MTSNNLLLLLSLLALATPLALRHDYWFNKNHPKYARDDDRWDYCDYKCLSMENMVADKDFIVVVFTAPLKETFSACYVKAGDSYTLWSHVL